MTAPVRAATRLRILGRGYFGVQATAGAAWWVAVLLVPEVRTATLGELPAGLVAALDVPLFVVASLVVAVGIRGAVWIVVPWTLLVTAGLGGYATVTGEAVAGLVIMVAASAGSLGAGTVVWWGRVPYEWLFVGPFAFRSAPSRSTRRNVVTTFAQMLLFWGLFLGVIPIVVALLEQRWGLDVPVHPGVRVAGAVLGVLASALGVWSALTMASAGRGTPLPAVMARRLVTTGPYRLVRNPMAIAGIAQGVAVGLLLGSWLVVGYAVVGSLVWNRLVRPGEEADLAARFGAEYEAYRARVRCWIPRVGDRRPAQLRSRG